MTRRKAVVAGLALLAALGVAVVALLLLPILDESAGREEGVTLNDVAYAPPRPPRCQ